MPKLAIFSGHDVCALLGKHGFALVRQKGSHAVMQSQTFEGTITVPVPLHRELKTGTLLSIIRQSQLPRVLFENPF
jgi:predicted RNA binding protein YcfA (HicA-like mRNA interferase family)